MTAPKRPLLAKTEPLTSNLNPYTNRENFQAQATSTCASSQPKPVHATPLNQGLGDIINQTAFKNNTQSESKTSLKNPAIDCIAIPTTESEQADLSLLFACWYLLHQGEQIAKKLIITLPGRENSKIADEICALLCVYKIKKMFAQADIYFLEIPECEDIYIRDPKGWNGKVPRLGLKSGPNIQFFETLRLARDSKYTFLNETDVLPLQCCWLTELADSLKEDHDWVLGAKYSGKSKLAPDIEDHINGAAVYNSGSKEFQDFCLQHWEPGLEQMCKDLPDTAYDIWVSRIKHSSSICSHHWQNMSHESQQSFTEAASRFAITDTIANLSLPTDIIPIKTLKKEGTSLVHGRHYATQSLANAIDHAFVKGGVELSQLQMSVLLSKTLRNRIHYAGTRLVLRGTQSSMHERHE